MNYLTGFLSFIYVLSCLFLIFVVLIQKGEGGGLGGAFGGGAVDAAFGSSADTAWKKATSVAAAMFILLSIGLGLLEAPPRSVVGKKLDQKTSGVEKVEKKASEGAAAAGAKPSDDAEKPSEQGAGGAGGEK